MRRALALLKYVPAVLCGLLAFGWGLSFFYRFYVTFPACFVGAHVGLNAGNLDIAWWEHHEGELYPRPTPVTFAVWERFEELPQTNWRGKLEWSESHDVDPFGGIDYVRIPILCILTFALPFALAPINKLPLWSYFAWTALLAAELAYYLR